MTRDIDARPGSPPKHGGFQRRVRAAWLRSKFLFVATLFLVSTGMASPTTLEYQVKAAFLLSFVTFTEWPATAFETPSSPLRICVAGTDPFDGGLARTLQGETVAGHPLVTQQIARGEDVTSCHVLFVPRKADDHSGALERGAAGSPILLVGESDALSHNGAIITFTIDEGRVRFDVNRTAAERSGLRLSSKLLRIARFVR